MDRVPSWTHHTELPADLASAARAREFVGVHLVEHGLPGLVENVRLVVSELAANAILHAQTTFNVTLHGDADSVLLTVRDRSPLLPLALVPQAMSTSGRGISIVAHLSRSWGTTTTDTEGGKSVWARFDQHHIS